MVKRVICLITFIICLLPFEVFANEKTNIYYFFENPCASCDSEAEFIDLFNNKVGDIKNQANFDLTMINTFKDGRQRLEQICQSLNIENYSLPILIIGDKYIYGKTEIETNMRSVFCNVFDIEDDNSDLALSSSNTIKIEDSLAENTANPLDIKQGTKYLRYYYTVSCDDCRKTSELLNKLKEKYPDIVIERFNIMENQYVLEIQKLFDKFKVDKNLRQVPIIFYQNGFISGYEQIESDIDKAINNSAYIDFLNLDQDNNLNNLYISQLPIILIAGFLNGLNPCGISMLFLVISILITEKKHILSLGFIYIITKGITYLIIAFGLYSVLSILEGNTFKNISQIIKVVAIIFMIAIAILNFLDFISCKREEYGKIKLQLPNSFRKFNNSIIEALKNPKFKKYIFLAIIVISIIVSASEFLCTGQIMLATLIYIVQNTAFNSITFMAIIIYIIAMLIPLIILVLLIYKGQKLFLLSETVRNHMYLIKLANSIIFIIFAIFIVIL